MNFLRLFTRNNSDTASAPAARERLQVLLAHERSAEGESELIKKLRDEIMAVIAKHVQVDDDKVQVKMERGQQMSTLAVDIEVPLDLATKKKKAA